MPSFLRLQTGINLVRFLENAPVREVRHWIDNKPVSCDGPGCKLCGAGFDKREQCIILVEMGDQQGLIRLPPVAWDIFYSQQGAAVLGAQVQITKTGTGLGTRYAFQVLEQGAVPPATGVPVPTPNPVPVVGAAGAVADSVASGSTLTQPGLKGFDQVGCAKWFADMLRSLAGDIESGKIQI